MKLPNSTAIDVKGIGLILFKSSKKYKRLSIQLKPFKGIEVLHPSNISVKKAMDFVETKRQWINKAQEVIKNKENKLTIFDENTVFKTKKFTLQIQKHSDTIVRIQLKNGILDVRYPENSPVEHSSIQDAIRFGIDKAMRLEAKNTLPALLSKFASKHGFTYKNVCVKNLKSRWGSCSSANNINLNIQLMRLPEHLIDYVILHELCHTKEKNHGANFWKLLNKYTDNQAKSLAKEMKNHATQIY